LFFFTAALKVAHIFPQHLAYTISISPNVTVPCDVAKGKIATKIVQFLRNWAKIQSLGEKSIICLE